VDCARTGWLIEAGWTRRSRSSPAILRLGEAARYARPDAGVCFAADIRLGESAAADAHSGGLENLNVGVGGQPVGCRKGNTGPAHDRPVQDARPMPVQRVVAFYGDDLCDGRASEISRQAQQTAHSVIIWIDGWATRAGSGPVGRLGTVGYRCYTRRRRPFAHPKLCCVWWSAPPLGKDKQAPDKGEIWFVTGAVLRIPGNDSEFSWQPSCADSAVNRAIVTIVTWGMARRSATQPSPELKIASRRWGYLVR